MIKFKNGIFTFCLLLICSVASAQLSKESCIEILNSVNLNDYRIVRVTTTTVGTTEVSSDNIGFSQSTTTFDFFDDYMVMKDGTGMTAIIPYTSIKLIKIVPNNNRYYSMFAIILRN